MGAGSHSTSLMGWPSHCRAVPLKGKQLVCSRGGSQHCPDLREGCPPGPPHMGRLHFQGRVCIAACQWGPMPELPSTVWPPFQEPLSPSLQGGGLDSLEGHAKGSVPGRGRTEDWSLQTCVYIPAFHFPRWWPWANYVTSVIPGFLHYERNGVVPRSQELGGIIK